MVAWLLAMAISAAPQMVVPRVDCGGAADAQAQSRCQAVATTLAAAITAEGLSRGPGERCEATPNCFELVAKTPGKPVFFELRDAKGIRLIAHTDEGDYRLPHKNEDLLVMAGFLTFVLAPLAVDLHKPTARADEEWAWRTTARRVLRQGLKKDQRFLGATEVRGQHWTATMATPRVGRVPVVEDLMVIQDKDYAPIDAESDEAREARYGASQAMASLVAQLDDNANFQIGDGKLTLVAILDQNGRFRSFVPRDNPTIFRNANDRILFKRAAFQAQGVPLPGFTRIAIPLTLRHAKGG